MITGAAGALGRELKSQLRSEADCRPRETLDVTHTEKVHETLGRCRPDVVVHAASFSDPLAAEDGPGRQRCWRVNVDGLKNVARACADHGLPLICLSSSRVFGGDDERRSPHAEYDSPSPSGFFGVSKLAGEHAVLHLGQTTSPDYWSRGFRYWILRTSEPYSREQHGCKSFVTCLRSMGPTVRLPAYARTSYTYIPHLAEAVVALINNARTTPCGVYHVCNAGAASYVEFALEMRRNGCPLSPVPVERPGQVIDCALTDRPYNTMLSNSAFEEATGYRMPCWREGLAAYFRDGRGKKHA